MSGTEIIDRIPNEDEADQCMAAFKAGNPKPTSVTKKKEADGTWTVTAVFD